MMDTLPNIPRLYTGIAEWAACLVYILILKKRLNGTRLTIVIIFGLIIQCMIQFMAGFLPLPFWIPGMLAAVCGMYLFIYICCDTTVRDVGFCCARAFILAEFTASLSWQLSCYFFLGESNHIISQNMGFTFLTYSVLFILMYFIEVRHMQKSNRLNVTHKELWLVICISLAVFFVSNISFVTVNTPFSGRFLPEVFYIRTLVDLCGIVILYAHQEQRREIQMQYELKAIQNILHCQFEQYQFSKESIEIINRKYHDLKHQISIIRAENDPDKRAAYLAEMEKGIKMYEAQNKTGNYVLDIVLTAKSMYCNEHGITMTCVANGNLLEFMDVMDICTIFGNALDNAIESAIKMKDPEKRLIRIALYSQNNFVIIRFENYFESEVTIEDELPATTKKDKNYHGFGLKSILHVVEKYDGSITVRTENSWFVLRVLIPSI